MGWRGIGLGCAAWAAVAGALASAAPTGNPGDDRLAAAKRFVEKSDRYLHHGKLRRGMEGYGLTVLAGTKIVKFQARVVSVLTRWGPHQDVILVMLSGQNLEHTGIIAGMSGSPIYIRDPADGKDKLIGAVAYGWTSQKDPLTGVQPITQMLASGAFFQKAGKAPKAAEKQAEPPVGGLGASAASRQPIEQFLATVLNPKKIDFLAAVLAGQSRGLRSGPAAAPGRLASDAPRLVPLLTPVMVSGARGRAMAELQRCLEPMGMVPLASGGVSPADAKAAGKICLEPGAALAVPMVVGDMDWSAVGTVTEVIGGRLLAFGHSFNSEGDVELPIGPAYVHTCVAGRNRSFKLSSGMDVAGTMIRDEAVGVSAVIGRKPTMIPMTVTVEHKDGPRKEVYRCRVAKHRNMTATMARLVLYNAAWGWHELPEHHTVRYRLSVDYGKLGTYRSENVSTGEDVYPVLSDLTRPIYGLMSNPAGKPVAPQRIDVTLRIEKGDRSARMIVLRLDGQKYRPGETITGRLIIRPFRRDRKAVPIRFELPDDLPEGTYSLTACDATNALSRLQSEMPHKFAGTTTQQLFDAMQRVVQPPADQLYLRLPVPGGRGVALEQRELPDLPGSRAAILAQARLINTRIFSRSLVRTLKTEYLISGSVAASFRVQREPAETLLRK